MQDDEVRGSRDAARGYRAPDESLFDGTTLARIVGFSQHYPLIAGSPLVAAQPGCAGDTGTILETKVVDVIEDGGGLLHITERRLEAKAGDLILVSRNPEHRKRLERTHAAAVIVGAELAEADVDVGVVEITAGKAWVEVMSRAPRIDLPALVARGELLQVKPRQNGAMSVKVGKREMSTYFAPIARSALEIGDAEVRRAGELGGGQELLEIRLPDGEGQSWWL